MPPKRTRKRYTQWYEKHMCLRTTPARIAAGVRLQTTPTRPNSFFEHLCPDVRWMIYDIMEFFPMPERTDYNGFYLTCKQAKQELDEAAAVSLRLRLLNVRRHFRRYRVEVTYPPELDHPLLPIHTPVAVKITVRLASFDETDCLQNIAYLAFHLHVLRFKRLYLHFIDGSGAGLMERVQRGYHLTARVLKELLGPDSFLAKDGYRLQVKDLRVSMETENTNGSEKPKYVHGYLHSLKITQQAPSTVSLYEFHSHDRRATVRVVMNRSAFERGLEGTRDKLGPVWTWRQPFGPVEKHMRILNLETGEFYSYPPRKINATSTNA